MLQEINLRLGDGVEIAVVIDPEDPDNDALLDRVAAVAPPLSEFGPVGDVGGGANVYDQLELLRRKVDGIGKIVDAALIGSAAPWYTGNLSILTRNGPGFSAAENQIGMHVVDPLVDDDHPLASALHLVRSVRAEAGDVTVNRPGVVLEAIYQGNVADDRPLLALRERLADGATRTGAWIEDDRRRTFSIQRDGTYYSRGGLLLFGTTAHAIIRGGDLYVEAGGVVCALDPDTTTDSASGAGIAMARTSATTAVIGDPYLNDLGTLSLQGNVRAYNPSGADSYVRCDAFRIDGQATKPTTLDASTWGLWVDSDDDGLRFWDGTTSTLLGGGGAPVTTEYCSYPSWSDDFGHAGLVLDRAFAWGAFGIGLLLTVGVEASNATVQGHESDGSRQTSYAGSTFNAEDEYLEWKWSTGVPEGFTAWGASGLGIKSKVTGLGAGDTCVVTLTAYNPSTGATSAATRTITADDASYIELTITPPGTWQGNDLLRFEIKADVTVWAASSTAITFKVGRIRTDWS